MHASSPYLTLDVKTLTDEEADRLVELLFPVHQRIFDGTDPPLFKQQVLRNRAEHSRLQVRFNRLGQVIGYCAVHFFPIDYADRPASVMRAQAGFLPEYRRGNRTAPFMLRTLLAYRLRHPWRRMYFFATLVHPSSYLVFDKYARKLWPRPSHHLSSDGWHFLQRCLAHFGHPAPPEAAPQVVPVGWRTLDREDDHAFWQASDHPSVRFFLRHNPGYGDGQGLVTLAPVSLANLFSAVGRLLGNRLRKRWRDGRIKTQCV
ncbi:MAG: hypothetical protein JO171_11865 [Paludibacterium sp.]|uniref:hypothetical protein n=1 Tax=Paludibacterium sp. TaxID=1917523 RepID=UPI0025CD4868|nr:hypothetical protein [Paludibacterium sp.]MBV8047846.1 hypothetical protein [Paludibacterium sp.]MBV8648140.1 hypothetical protein [Paludibacterium sp.]